jgi:NAD(P)-dependent dehydrogenase (short-subunit alcohol dehydrogenase family)
MYSLPDMSGRIVVLSGATSGIGRQAAICLARANAHLIAVARSEAKAEQLLADCRAQAPAATVQIVMGDLMERAGVHQVADQVEEATERIDLLLNNAGALFSTHALTIDGFERTWALNHLGYHLLTTRLVSRVRQGSSPRIINVASNAHRGARMNWEDLQFVHSRIGKGWKTYCHSKLANILFTKGLAARLEGTGVVANCIHPGFVATGFNRNNGALANLLMTLGSPFARTPARGAETLLWAAASTEAAELSGEYLADCKVRLPTRWGRSLEDAERLWQITEEMTDTVGAWSG